MSTWGRMCKVELREQVMKDYESTMGFCSLACGSQPVHAEAVSILSRLHSTTMAGSLLYYLTKPDLERTMVRKGCQAVYKRNPAAVARLHPALSHRAMQAITLKL